MRLYSLQDGGEAIDQNFLDALFEGGIRLLLFVLYLWAISWMPDIRRVFGYHGAEHKTINAYEAGDELSVAAVQRHSVQHTRCGTSFLLYVLVRFFSKRLLEFDEAGVQ